MRIGKAKLSDIYTRMVKIRCFEERVAEMYAKGLMPGLAHLYVGEEAVAVGTCVNLRADDYITSTHRGHGHLIAKGGEFRYMMAELFGKKTGYCKGKGGSMHIANLELGILGANGIAGGGLPLATGAGLSAKVRGTDQVAACFFGDGASNNGTFHESLNFAAVHKLPVIYVCENNQYGISTSTKQAHSVQDISVRATAYGIPGVMVDGNDVLEVYPAVNKAVRRARAGEGPTLIECKTYRFRGHHEGDPNQGARYRSKEEMEDWRVNRDPIKRLASYLIHEEILNQGELDHILEETQRQVDEAVEFAREGPFPAAEDLLTDVFCTGDQEGAP